MTVSGSNGGTRTSAETVGAVPPKSTSPRPTTVGCSLPSIFANTTATRANQEGLQSRIKGAKEKNGPFDAWGCNTNVQNLYAADWFEEGAEKPLNATQDLWGPNQYIDAKKWHELAWYFKPDENGDIDAIWVQLKQGNKAAVVPVCTDEIMAKGDPDFPKGWSKTYLKMFSRHLKGGLKWNVQHTKWQPFKGSMAWLSNDRNGHTNPHCDRNATQEFPELEISTEGEHFKNVRIFTPGK